MSGKSVLSLPVAALASVIAAHASAQVEGRPSFDERPLVGQPAPNLIGRRAFGTGLIKLDKLRPDNVVVLNFFDSECEFCVDQIPAFNRLAKSFRGRPVVFLYVNLDTGKSMSQIVEFAKENGMEEVELMLPSVRNAIELFKIEYVPKLVFVDRQGIVSHVIVGFPRDFEQQVHATLLRLLSPDS
jgi:thiol-disulfide isomerase/thioredoxin